MRSSGRLARATGGRDRIRLARYVGGERLAGAFDAGAQFVEELHVPDGLRSELRLRLPLVDSGESLATQTAFLRSNCGPGITVAGFFIYIGDPCFVLLQSAGLG